MPASAAGACCTKAVQAHTTGTFIVECDARVTLCNFNACMVICVVQSARHNSGSPKYMEVGGYGLFGVMDGWTTRVVGQGSARVVVHVFHIVHTTQCISDNLSV